MIYLDLNHWIGLARAHQGTGTQDYVNLLASLRKAVSAGNAKVVLTGSLFREVSKIGNSNRRASLSELIGELTGFTYLSGLPDVFRLELQAVLDAETNTRGLNFGAVDLLGASALHSMGRVGGLRIMRDGVDVTEEMIQRDPGWRDRIAEMERVAEHALLAGPADSELPDLRAAGYHPERPQQQVRDNAAFEQDWAARIAPFRTTHQLRDLALARHVMLELIDMLRDELHARGLEIDQVLSGSVAARDIVLRMPSSAAMVSLIAQYHQDPNKVWKQNDLYDIDALAVAVPYCDIVFTDAAARDALLRRSLDVVMSTTIPRRPADLSEILEGLDAGT